MIQFLGRHRWRISIGIGIVAAAVVGACLYIKLPSLGEGMRLARQCPETCFNGFVYVLRYADGRQPDDGVMVFLTRDRQQVTSHPAVGDVSSPGLLPLRGSYYVFRGYSSDSIGVLEPSFLDTSYAKYNALPSTPTREQIISMVDAGAVAERYECGRFNAAVGLTESDVRYLNGIVGRRLLKLYCRELPG